MDYLINKVYNESTHISYTMLNVYCIYDLRLTIIQ